MTTTILTYCALSNVFVGVMCYFIGQARADARATRDLEELRRMM